MMSPDEYHALRALDSTQLETLLQGIREDRWSQFRSAHLGLLWATAAAFVCGFLASASPAFGFITFILFLCPLSLGISAISRAAALGRECRFFRRSHQIAREAPTYEDFREAYARKVANF